MKYPRIFSLSTVGIIKHYNQDYLIHPIRTDFTGSNGVGKSIIADLLQLIFISDESLIAFGTDGVDPGERQINSLPYKTSEGYAFLNLEIQKDAFITIGVCIPNQRGRRIKPFVVVKDIDLEKEIGDLTFSKEQILTIASFIKEGNFLTLDELSKHLRDKHSLYLKHFTYKEDKDEYYSFLFNKEILSINLSIEDNLKAFAKIIQSFSKAKTLKIRDSRSLQEFLFEDNEKEFEQTFSQHKSTLQKLINEYKNLESYIVDLERKQHRLQELKLKEEKKESQEKTFLETEILFCFQEMKNCENEFIEIEKELKKRIEQSKYLEKRLPQLKRLHKKSEVEFNSIEESLKNLREYKDVFNNRENLNSEIKGLTNLDAPKITEEFQIKINLDDYDNKEIIRKVNYFKPIYIQYKTLSGIKDKVTEQKNQIAEYKTLLQNDIEKIRNGIQLLNNNKKNTLFSKVLEKGKSLSIGQEAILFELLDVQWNKPKEIVKDVRYTTSEQLLNEENIEEDILHKGFWFNLGDIWQFFLYRKEKRLFDDPSNLKKAFEKRKKDLEKELNNREEEVIEINKFEQGDSYDLKKISLKYPLDQNLKDYSALQDLEKTALIIRNLNKIIVKYESQINNLEKNLNILRKKIFFPIRENEIENQIREIEDNLKVKRVREANLRSKLSNEEVELKSLKESIIPLLQNQVEEKEQLYKRKKTIYIGKDITTKKIIPELDIDLLSPNQILEEDVISKQRNFNSAKEDYITEYKLLISLFAETQNNSNPEVNEQTTSELYGFHLLEVVLLGPRIKYIDNIAYTLRDANRSRLSMVEAIHETMFKIFNRTKNKYEEYKTITRGLNTFFKGRKISDKYYFQIDFNPHPEFNIEWINQLQAQSQAVYKNGELPFGETVETFVEEFFRKTTGFRNRINFTDLLDPRSYFKLEVRLSDENNKNFSGSTGESYSAILLLGIGRLSKVQNEKRKGIRFIIIEETASLDSTNFNTFPNIAEEFGYQILTMTPKPYGSDSDSGWYLHHLIPGTNNGELNYPIPSSYFKTNESQEDLETYLQALKKNELDSTISS